MRTTNFVCSILAAAIATTSMVTAVAVDQVQLIPTDLAQAEGAIQLEGGTGFTLRRRALTAKQCRKGNQ